MWYILFSLENVFVVQLSAGHFMCVCNGISVLVMNKTTSMPKSVLRYDVDKDLISVCYSVFTQSCFPNKRLIDEGELNRFLTSFRGKRGESARFLSSLHWRGLKGKF